MALVKLITLLSLVVTVRSNGADPIVRVTHGLIQGSWRLSTHGRIFASFNGVPYASPPVGEYRYREPQQMTPWAGVWNATHPLPNCIHYNPIQKIIKGREDCLFLNVHIPKLLIVALLPVVVFIHGGAFMFGEGWIDPSNLMDRDVVFVTFNYRLGPIGFLSTGDDTVPGNAGLKDQSFALKWIRDNIEMFGGNPGSVTLVGQSAGGVCVHYHFLSPLSKGTFHRGIALSGSALSPWTYSTKPLEKAKTLAAIMGCPTHSTREMAECLKFRPAESIVRAQIEMFEWKIHAFTPFTPTVEGPGSTEPFLTQYPYIASKHMHRLPIIVSVVSAEGSYPAAAYKADRTTIPELNARWDHLASNIFEYNDTLPISKRASVANKIKQFYLNDTDIDEQNFSKLVEALGDRLFLIGSGKFAQIHAHCTNEPTYVYRYTYRTQCSSSNPMSQNNVDYGVSHGEDIMLIFNTPQLNTTCPADLQMREVFLDMMYSYASTGIPKIFNAPEWLQVKPDRAELPYLEIARPQKYEMMSTLDFGHRKFWDSMGFHENENYHINTGYYL